MLINCLIICSKIYVPTLIKAATDEEEEKLPFLWCENMRRSCGWLLELLLIKSDRSITNIRFLFITVVNQCTALQD